MKTISIVIPNWNGEGKLKKNLPFVIDSTKDFNVKEIIVVDDKSTDQSVEILKKEFPDIKLIEKNKNTGFSSTVNLGVKSANSDLVVLLNSDASPKKDFLKYLVPHFEEKQIFSVSCNVGGVWNVAQFKEGFFWHSQAAVAEKDKNSSHNTVWASGGSGIFRKDIWDRLGGLDELFDPFYEEDLDLGYRALKRGYINLWEPKSQVDHYQEAGVIEANFSKERVARVAQRNQLQFIWKNITSKQLIQQHNKALVKKIIQHPKYWLIVQSALINLPALLEKRAIEIKESTVTDEEILEANGS